MFQDSFDPDVAPDAQKKSALTKVWRRFWTHEGGSAVLELAFVMPVYIMLVFGFVSAALLLFVYSDITYASRAAVRYASVRSAATSTPCAQSDIDTMVRAAVPVMNGGQLSSPATWTLGNTVGGTVSVNVRVTYSTGVPFFGNSSFTLSNTATSAIVH